MALLEIAFNGGKRIDAVIAGHSISTDQSIANGGENAAPEPFQLFLASIATCAGIYAKSFCDERGLSSPRRLELDLERRDDGRLSRLDFQLEVDADFPAKYERVIVRAMELCAVKKQLREDIETSIRITRDGS